MLKYASLAVAMVKAGGPACADRKQWADCVMAYANGECHSNVGECDRTCERCDSSANICFDMIPPHHTAFYDLGSAVKSEWPNASNNGGNSFPRKQVPSDQFPNFPFDPANVSNFCLDVFVKQLCDQDDLPLIYDAGTTYERKIILYGKASEFCKFTCGNCGHDSTCYKEHNTGMTALWKPEEGAGFGGGLEDFDWNSFDSFDFSAQASDFDDSIATTTDTFDSGDDWGNSWGSDDSWGSFDDTTDDTASDSWESASDDSWGGGWGWRKKRDLPGVGRSEILKSAVQNIVSHLEHGLELNPKMKAMALSKRKKRQSGMLGQSSEIDFEKRQRNLDLVKGDCWFQNLNDLSEEEEVLEEAEENFEGEAEEEGNDNYISQITERREELDNDGISYYFSNLNNEATLGACSYFPMPYGEPDMYMPLHYVCGLSCGEGQAPFAYNSMTETAELIEFNEDSETFEFNMECERKHKGMKPKEPSDCGSMEHPNLRIICQEVEEPEEIDYDQEVTEEESSVADELADYYANNFMLG